MKKEVQQSLDNKKATTYETYKPKNKNDSKSYVGKSFGENKPSGNNTRGKKHRYFPGLKGHG